MGHMGIHKGAFALGVSLLVFVALPAAAGAWNEQCRNLVRLTDLSYAVEPGVVVPESENLPHHCRVRGVINRAIRFEVTMPIPMGESMWNGRLMFSTVGGGAGVIGDTTSLLGRGYAMASTDTGHGKRWTATLSMYSLRRSWTTPTAACI